MNRVFSIIIVLSLLLSACGHRKAPSGGPADTTPPTVLDVQPAPLDELGRRITVVFSKPIDRNTTLTGVKLYPPVLNRKFRWPEPTTMVIDLREELATDTNYTLWLGTELKDTHGNPLAEQQVYSFRHGELQTARIAGTFDWERPELAGLPVYLDLFSADTTFIAGWRVREPSFALEHLNEVPHLLRAWADVEADGRYRYGTDPRAEVFTGAEARVSLQLHMAVEDTLPPALAGLQDENERQLVVRFDEPLAAYAGLEIVSDDSLRTPRPVTHAVLHGDELHLLLSPIAEGKYMLRMQGLRDPKGNRTERDSLYFEAMAKPDSLAPSVLASTPRNGAVLSEAQPVIAIRFSEIIPADSVRFHLRNAESDDEVPLEVLAADSDRYELRPAEPLEVYATYRLSIDETSADAAGNRLVGDREFRWIVVPPQD